MGSNPLQLRNYLNKKKPAQLKATHEKVTMTQGGELKDCICFLFAGDLYIKQVVVNTKVKHVLRLTLTKHV